MPFLREAGAEVLFSEVDEKAIQVSCDKPGLQYVPSEVVYTTEFDIFAPCTLGSVLNATTVPRLKWLGVAALRSS